MNKKHLPRNKAENPPVPGVYTITFDVGFPEGQQVLPASWMEKNPCHFCLGQQFGVKTVKSYPGQNLLKEKNTCPEIPKNCELHHSIVELIEGSKSSKTFEEGKSTLFFLLVGGRAFRG